MKAVAYRVEPQKTIWGVTIRILDHDAVMDTLTNTYTGFTLDDAKESANCRLNKFGYELGRLVTDDEMDEWL